MALEGGCLELLASASRLTLDRHLQRPAWLSRVADYLRAEFRRTPSLSELAAVADVHPCHLLREFKRAFGETPAARIRRLRLEWSAPRVIGTNEPLVSIAAAAGFSDQSHFTRQFRRHFGVTPIAYRRERKKL
jgi:AraC family transcriptional regulator